VCSDLTTFVGVRDQHICVAGDEGKSICSGSLGGPLVVERNGKPVQVGVASFYSGNCATDQPSGFTRLTYKPIYDWIKKNM
jgi:secreted trypsin-like serine protease